MDENKEEIENVKNLTKDINKCENEIINVINSYNFNPSISRLIIIEILRLCENSEKQLLV